MDLCMINEEYVAPKAYKVFKGKAAPQSKFQSGGRPDQLACLISTHTHTHTPCLFPFPPGMHGRARARFRRWRRRRGVCVPAHGGRHGRALRHCARGGPPGRAAAGALVATAGDGGARGRAAGALRRC
eukprot:351054-Chlamydomonas_euryale.AAC.1